MPGIPEMVDVGGGRKIRAFYAGSGDTLVVFESGMGAGGRYWQPVQRLVQPHASTLAYDRAGYGGSTPLPPSASSRELDDIAADLHTLIETRPQRRLILVGHSWGGPIVRTSARSLLRAGYEIAALVLVDPSDEHAAIYFGPANRWSTRVNAALHPILYRTGLARSFARRLLEGLEEPALTEAVADASTAAAQRAAVAENAALVAGLRQLKQEAEPLSVPMSVISGQLSTWSDRGVRRQLVAAHRESADVHPQGAFIEATDSGHMVLLQEPERVASVINSHLRRT